MRSILTLALLALPLACGTPTPDTSAVPGTTTDVSDSTADDTTAADDTTTRGTTTTAPALSDTDTAANSEPGTTAALDRLER